MYMMLDSKIQKIQSCKHIRVPGDLDKQGPTVWQIIRIHKIKYSHFLKLFIFTNSLS